MYIAYTQNNTDVVCHKEQECKQINVNSGIRCKVSTLDFKELYNFKGIKINFVKQLMNNLSNVLELYWSTCSLIFYTTTFLSITN